MVGPLLKMTLVPDKEMSKSTIPVFFDLLDQEYKMKGNFKQVGNKRTIDTVHGAVIECISSIFLDFVTKNMSVQGLSMNVIWYWYQGSPMWILERFEDDLNKF